tara:strand:+ start:28 stop:453 length:426 start_codon:yes stop_codon:yes gene_type:complete
LSNKISDQDKKDWESFISNKEKVPNKDLSLNKNKRLELTKIIDLHGHTLENANKVIDQFINKCFEESVTRIIVITGKGTRSNSASNPYVSYDLSILKHSVPEFIKSNTNLMKIIINIADAKIEDGGGGAFYIYLKKKLKNK